MSSFGQWYEEQKAQENAGATEVNSSSSWIGGSTGENGEQILPLFGDTSQYSFSNFKSSLESQLPQKILGMNYQTTLSSKYHVTCIVN